MEFEMREPSLTATEILERLPAKLGPERADAIYELAADGNIPMFLRQWVEVNVTEGELTGTYHVLPDFFCLGTDEDYIYVPMGALTAERIGSIFTAQLPTIKMVKQVYERSNKQVAQPWGPPYDHSMTRTSRWPVQTAKIRKSMGPPGELVEGHMKNVIISKRTLDNQGRMLGFYGWYDSKGKPIQGDSQAHGAGYCDYAHGIRYVLSSMVVNETEFLPLGEVLKHKDYHRLISDEVLSFSTYKGIRSQCGISTLLY